MNQTRCGVVACLAKGALGTRWTLVGMLPGVEVLGTVSAGLIFDI